jgi:hypothetical protein
MTTAERLAARTLRTTPTKDQEPKRRRVRIYGGTRGGSGGVPPRPRNGAEVIAARVLSGESVRATAHWREVASDWVRF